MENLASRVVLAAVASALALAAGEGVLRVRVDLPPAKPLPQVRYDPDPARRFTTRPGQEGFTRDARVRVDERGFRANGAGAPAQAEGTILALGDSFTFGMGVADDRTWPSRLERLLHERRPGRFRVVNAGTISYGVFQEMDLLREKGLDTDPEIVIHGLYWNDYMSAHPPRPGDPPALTEAGYFVWDDPTPPPGFLRRSLGTLSNRSALLFTLKRTVRRVWGTDRDVSAYEAAYERFVKGQIDVAELAPIGAFYEELAALGVERGFRVYVVIFPVLGLVGRPGAAEHPYARFVRSELDRLGIAYVDGIALWEREGFGTETYVYYDRHLNERGYEIIAGELDRLLAAEQPVGAVRAGE